ncbi:MAG: hypothetical protein WA871_12295 [Candidatus Acidiferrales bacterium]
MKLYASPNPTVPWGAAKRPIGCNAGAYEAECIDACVVCAAAGMVIAANASAANAHAKSVRVFIG